MVLALCPMKLWSPSYKLSEGNYFLSFDRAIAQSLGRSVARSLDRSVARSLDRSVAQSLGRWVLDRGKDKGARISIEISAGWPEFLAGFSRSQPIYAVPRFCIEFRALLKLIVFGGSSLGVFQGFYYGRQKA